MKRRFWFLWAALLCARWPVFGMDAVSSTQTVETRIDKEVQEVRKEGYQAFLEGRFEDSRNSYRYLEVMGSDVDRPDENLAILDRDSGKNDQALAHWMRASLNSDADGFVFNQEGWAYLSAGNLREAKEAFSQALKHSLNSSQQAESYLGLGTAENLDGHPKLAIKPLGLCLTKSPYILSVAYDKTGETELRLKNLEAAVAAFNQSVSLDLFNFEAMVDLARLEFKIGENKDAWILYHHLLSLEPGNPVFARILKSIEKYLAEPASQILLEKRISRPFLSGDISTEVDVSSPTIRVALFCGEKGRPHTMTRVYFMTNRSFKIVSSANEVIRDNIGPYNQWQISFESENGLIEVRDTEGNIEYATKEPFKIIPSSGSLGSVLLKSAHFSNTIGFDSGDRELRGTIEVFPNPEGFKLVNETGVEDYLYGVVGRVMGGQEPAQAYRAAAVVARTTALWYKSLGRLNLEKSDICDSFTCQSYRGVTSEMSRSTKGVQDTNGEVLSYGGRIAKVAWHQDCGGFTEEGADYPDPQLKHLVSVVDAPTAISPPDSPADFERWIHGFPPDSLFSNSAPVRQTYSRWVRIIPADSIRQRIKAFKDIGKIRHIEINRRSETGRVLEMTVIGAKGSWKAANFSQIQEVLSPHSLRSSLFTLTPVSDGRFVQFFVLWGAGTGSGLGLCLNGTLGQASLGINWKDILKRYFPQYQIERAYGLSSAQKISQTSKKKSSRKKKRAKNRNWKAHFAAKKKAKKPAKKPIQNSAAGSGN